MAQSQASYASNETFQKTRKTRDGEGYATLQETRYRRGKHQQSAIRKARKEAQANP